MYFVRMEELKLRTLIALFLDGDQRAFYLIVEDYKDEIFTLCFNLLSDYDEANDVAQDVFIKVYKSIGKFNFESKFSTWLYRVTVNTCISYIHKVKKNRTVRVEESIDEINAIPAKDSSDKTTVAVKEALNKIPQKEKTILVLKDIDGFSYKEIAEILNINIGTVRSRISRARESMKHHLRGYL